jgi:hypothetical protein
MRIPIVAGAPVDAVPGPGALAAVAQRCPVCVHNRCLAWAVATPRQWAGRRVHGARGHGDASKLASIINCLKLHELRPGEPVDLPAGAKDGSDSRSAGQRGTNQHARTSGTRPMSCTPPAAGPCAPRNSSSLWPGCCDRLAAGGPCSPAPARHYMRLRCAPREPQRIAMPDTCWEKMKHAKLSGELQLLGCICVRPFISQL